MNPRPGRRFGSIGLPELIALFVTALISFGPHSFRR